jgi:4a-hydroxytetrahydrobiopterin dehydratase
MAALLDDSAIEEALVSLPSWRRVDNTLVRDVSGDGQAAERLEAAVAAAADELNHHPVVDRSADGLRFTVWSHSDGGITGKDVALARRIDEAIAGSAESPPA